MHSDSRRQQRRQAVSKHRSVVIFFWVVGALIVTGIILGGFAAKRVYDHAMEVRSHLTAAMPHIQEVQRAVLASDPVAARTAAAAFASEAQGARAATEGRAWGFFEGVPLGVVDNLRTVRVVAEVADDLARDVVIPAAEVQLSALLPAGGAVNVAALTEMITMFDSISAHVDESKAKLDALNRAQLIAEVEAGLVQLDDALARVDGVLDPLNDVLPLLPRALGSEGPRNYLFAFQGNSEMRALGGNPASFLLLRMENGALSVTRQATSADFENARSAPVTPLDPEIEKLYGDIVGRWIPNVTSMPDFPSAVNLISAYWAEEFDDQIDAVISVDPVALSYLLAATGPLTLPTGDVLSSDNAVSLLLKDVYLKYPTNAESDIFFNAAAMTVFGAVTSGSFAPVPFFTALAKAAEQGRILIWSTDPQEAEAIGDLPLSGILPKTNSDATAIGVFFNDTTGAKMGYFLDANIDLTAQCAAGAAPTWRSVVTVQNNASVAETETFPEYIVGLHYRPGTIATDFLLYSPVGASIDSWTVDGASSGVLMSAGTHLGRDVIRVSVTIEAGATAVFNATMTGSPNGAATGYGPLIVRSTPMVRDTPVVLNDKGCE